MTTSNGFARHRPDALTRQSWLWGRDNRGAMLRVIGKCDEKATRIENRIGELLVNTYLYLNAQIHGGLDGLQYRLRAPKPTELSYGHQGEKLPTSLPETVQALCDDQAMAAGMGMDFACHFAQIKAGEMSRNDAAEDQNDFQRPEYSLRF